MTILISSQSVSKSYGSNALFSNISLGFFENERLGLIGPNGSGKTTLLKIFAEQETSDSGTIVRKRGTHLVYLPQNDQLAPLKSVGETLLEALPESMEEEQRHQQVNEIFREMHFKDKSQKVGSLSGGWRKRVAIAQSLIQSPDLLLMDEPTNHLDLEGILWLEELLKNAPFAFVLVSHDRYFLENTTNRIVELNKQYPDGFLKVEGSYSDFIQKREEFLHEQSQQEQVLSNKVRRELEWLRRGPKARGTKAQFRIDNAEQLQNQLSEVKSRNAQNQKAQLDFEATHRKTKKLIETKDLTITRGGQQILKKVNVTLSPKTCLGLMGSNGSGKSTLLKLLTGELSQDSGSITKANGVQIVTFDQTREQLNPNQTLKQALAPAGDSVIYRGRSLHVAAWASRFLFPRAQLNLPVAQLSGGEHARVLIANLMLKPADVLLLDEPTNDLDIPTLEVLEESLQDFPGAIVLVTHDRFLLDRLSDKILYLDGQGNAEYFADYDQWYQKHKVRSSQPTTSSEKRKALSKMSYEDQKELNRMNKKIEKAEEMVTTLQQQLQNLEVTSNAARLTKLCAQLKEAEINVDRLYRRWEELEALKE
ncbi:ABC-F family ATP-binding cassette domain-containing protein [Deltaproteobacteria bacterium TL4]